MLIYINEKIELNPIFFNIKYFIMNFAVKMLISSWDNLNSDNSLYIIHKVETLVILNVTGWPMVYIPLDILTR